MNIFDEIQHRLASKARIRSLFKDVHIEDVERIISRMKSILAEKKEALAADEAKRQAKQENINEVRRLLAERGLSLDDLGAVEETAPRKRRNVQKLTFQYETNSGDTVTWHGSTTGRLPKDFQTYLDRTGKKRLDCVVED